ncbi:hypothetical protein Taro_037978 [Colocasia esculenta]|uniref:Uncharacterized protein n=1 Tax=Colocasia esculenta TaxID=4460 RepID=A0A843WRC1_COLES|nr:hypothetical protein [Colocasia esculenta]
MVPSLHSTVFLSLSPPPCSLGLLLLLLSLYSISPPFSGVDRFWWLFSFAFLPVCGWSCSQISPRMLFYDN